MKEMFLSEVQFDNETIQILFQNWPTLEQVDVALEALGHADLGDDYDVSTSRLVVQENLTIKEAQMKLYNELKPNSNFVGVSIEHVNLIPELPILEEREVLMVMLSKEDESIPHIYEGFPVETKVTGEVYLQDNKN